MVATLLEMTKPTMAFDHERLRLEFLPKETEQRPCGRCCSDGLADASFCCEQLEQETHQVTMSDVEITRPAQGDAFPHRDDEEVWSMIQGGLARAGHRLNNVTCTVDATTLCLGGTVHRYFHLQQAIEIARRLAFGRRIDLQVAVISRPDKPSQV
ncbi:hypothetical protein [Schlesneria paludicola]|uniref:hypothetical protein n=1 Tax=Schlesneria paludicola TaxID=360056 RepID=UPI00029A6105|nr:hypothetical protein [Schlesneria paludicola]